MKRYLLTLTLLGGVLFGASAQSNKIPTATDIASKYVQALEKSVTINTTQRSIITNYAMEMAKEQVSLYKKQQSGQFSENDMPKFYKLQNETNDGIRSILKGEQQVAFDAFLEKQLRGGDKKKKKNKKGKEEEEEVVTGISGLILPTSTN